MKRATTTLTRTGASAAWVGSRVCGDERNEARDVETEDAVGVEILARFHRTGLKLRIGRRSGRGFPVGGEPGPVSARHTMVFPNHPKKVEIVSVGKLESMMSV